VSGLDFSDPDRGYTSLTGLWVLVVDPTGTGGPGCGTVGGSVVCEKKERPLVTPYDPQASRLINVLRAQDAPRMPPDRPLAEADIRLIEKWILGGAKRGTGPDDAGADGGGANDGTSEAGEAGGDDASDAAADVAGDGAAD
jgi:hypothetical protein